MVARRQLWAPILLTLVGALVCLARAPGFPLPRVSLFSRGFRSLWPESSGGETLGRPCYEPLCEDCESNGTIYFAHQDCWKVARTRASIVSLVRLAVTARPLFSSHLVQGARAKPPVDVLLNETNPLRQLPMGIYRRLPVELQVQILQSVGDSFRSCLLTAVQTATLAASPPPDDKLLRTQALGHDGPITSIHGSVPPLFGREYLVDIGFNGDEGRRLAIAVEKTSIAGIQFALDTHGLCAIRVKYGDKRVSPGLGNRRGAWYGQIPCNRADLRGLRLLRDELRILQISPPSRPRGFTPTIWSSEVPLDDGLEYIAYVERDAPTPESAIAFWPGWRACPYLPLATGESYISGLTAYCKSGCISGWVTHGNSDGERITGAYVLPSYDPDDEVHNLVVVTDCGRTCFFGLYKALRQGIQRYSEWVFLIEHCDAGIAGLFCDSGSVIGVSQVRSEQGPAAAAPSIPTLYSPPPLGRLTKYAHPNLCFSSASLGGARSIQLRRVRDRVTGLLVEHHDRVEVLGAWDPADTKAISAIYESSRDGPLNGLAIDRKQYQVVDVAAVTEKCPCPAAVRPPSRRDTFQAAYNKRIAWWFDEVYDEVKEMPSRTMDVEGAMAESISPVK